MKRILILAALLAAFSCGEKSKMPAVLEAASGLSVEKISPSSVRLTWTDNCAVETGYLVFARVEGTSYYPQPLAGLPANSTEYLFQGLSEGTAYYFGVQAVGEGDSASPLVYSEQIVTDVTVIPEKDDDNASEDYIKISAISADESGIAVTYSISKIAAANPRRGICISTEHNPTVGDMVFPGPGGKSGTQFVSSAALSYGVEYRVRAYVYNGEKVLYTSTSRISLGSEPEATELSWTEVTGLDLPSAVKVYKTTDPLGGEPFNAWYAVADASEVDFRVLCPDKVATVDAQAEAEEGCLVLINGGIFNQTQSKPIGFAVTGGVQTEWRVASDGLRVDNQYWSADGKLHPVTRGTFGVDENGTALAGWSYTPEYGKVLLYGLPLASMAGEPVYAEPSGESPCRPSDAILREAVTCGPVLLMNGNVTVSLSKSPSGWWTSNFELWADDIFASKPDRTAVGYTADGKIILFVCDGRIAGSKGAYPGEVARILKGLGCVAAVNLDGGGSTGMWARGGGHLNSLKTGSGDEEYNRPVLTTLGFFSK